MQLTRPLTFKMTFAFLSLMLLGSCALDPTRETKTEKILERANEKVIKKTNNQRVFQYPYDAVWRASQLALKYPIAINNMDNGTLETEWIKAADGFQSPVAKKEPSSGIKYKISLTLVKGKLDTKESVRMTIVKQMERVRDFFSEPETLETDGLEEKILFYRIERELLVDEGLKKATAASQNKK